VAVVILIAISRSPSLCFLLACDCENDDLRIESILARFWRTGLCAVALVLWVEVVDANNDASKIGANLFLIYPKLETLDLSYFSLFA
jgi:hypothetical protein